MPPAPRDLLVLAAIGLLWPVAHGLFAAALKRAKISHARSIMGDTFTKDGFDRAADGKKWTFDYMLANPPFGGMEEDGIETNFPSAFAPVKPQICF